MVLSPCLGFDLIVVVWIVGLGWWFGLWDDISGCVLFW